MKTIYDFIYCKGKLTRNCVWYSVRVGKNKRDLKAKGFLESVTRGSSDFLFIRHSAEMALFKEKCAAALFPCSPETSCSPVLLLRQKQVEIAWLCQFIKKYPANLLNSFRLETNISHANMQLLNGLVIKKCEKTLSNPLT